MISKKKVKKKKNERERERERERVNKEEKKPNQPNQTTNKQAKPSVKLKLNAGGESYDLWRLFFRLFLSSYFKPINGYKDA